MLQVKEHCEIRERNVQFDELAREPERKHRGLPVGYVLEPAIHSALLRWHSVGESMKMHMRSSGPPLSDLGPKGLKKRSGAAL